jgi:hypothetical protein
MKKPHLEKKDLLPFLIYLYLFLPFALFLIGWTKPIVSIPVLIVLTVCFYRMVMSFPELWLPKISRENILNIGLILFVIFVWVYFSGIGGFAAQNSDHSARNGIFETLVTEKWPVVNFSSERFGQPVALVYYFGFWLPAAIIGKLFGLKAGYIVQIIWASTGIFFFYYLIIAKYIKKIVFWPLLVVIFFSGLDILGIYLLRHRISDVPITAHKEWWAVLFQFSSMTTQLFWVFNQAIPAWFATLILLVQKNNRYIAVIIALTMITSTLPFVGLVVLAICVIVKNFISKDIDGQVRFPVRDIFTFENIFGVGVIGIISFLFLKANIYSRISFPYYLSARGIVLLWFLFYIVEAGIYAIAVWKYHKRNYLLYYSAFWLAVCPWVMVGFSADFCMRASIPALVILLLLVIDTINKSYSVRDFRILITIIVILAIGSYTPISEITRTTINTVARMRNNQPIALEKTDIWLQQFSGIIKDSIFFDYLARIPKEK